MLIPSGYGQVTFKFGGFGMRFPGVMTLGLDVSAALAPIEEIADDLTTIMSTFIDSNAISSSLEFRGVLLKYGPTATGPSVETSTVQAGTGSSQASSQVAYLIHKNTALGGRAGKGRMYLPGVTESAVNANGSIDSGTLDTLTADIETFGSAIAALGIDPVVLHGEDSPLSTPTPITSLTVDSIVATQRRRLRR